MSNSPPSHVELPASMSGVAVRSLRNESLIILKNVDLQVQAGDFWVVAGLQGSGKTDLLLTLAGLMPPAGGTYRLFGQDMPIFDEPRMPTRLRVGLVFETGQLFSHLTVAENIFLPLRYHRNLSHSEAAAALSELIDMLGIGPYTESMPGALGRNWQRRVGLARALALRPEFLLVDSPLAGLDLPQTMWWLDILGSLSKGHQWLEGKPVTLLVTAADLRPWRPLARQYAVVRGGGFHALGSWKQVAANTDELAREVLGEENRGFDAE